MSFRRACSLIDLCVLTLERLNSATYIQRGKRRARFAVVCGALALVGGLWIWPWDGRNALSENGFFKWLYAWLCWLGGLAFRQWHLRTKRLKFPTYYWSIEWTVIGVASAFGICAFLEHFLGPDESGVYFSAAIPLGIVAGLYTHPETFAKFLRFR